MNELLKYKDKYDKLYEKCNLSGKEALSAVKQNSYILQFVNENIFSKTQEMTVEEVCKELGRDIKIIK